MNCEIEKNNVLISWKIQTFDRQRKEFSDRFYILDWDKTSKYGRNRIIEILGISKATQENNIRGIGIQSFTWSIGVSKPDDRMLEFRHLFVERTIADFEKSGDKTTVFCGVNLNRDYYEDETCREISLQEIIRIKHGDNAILFDAQTIASIGPTEIRNKESWTVDKANTVFNFIQVIKLIWNSNWARKRISLTEHFSDNIQVKITHDFPTVESMCAVLTLFRQLYAKDSLMEKTCRIYNEHSSNHTKIMWVENRLKVFKQSLGDAPMFINIQGITIRELLQVFLYATGLIHSVGKDNHAKRNKFSELVRQNGQEKITMAVSDSFWTVLRYSIDIFHVVKQDYEYWTEKEECVKSDMFNLYSLLHNE